jgi:hypothetical protein
MKLKTLSLIIAIIGLIALFLLWGYYGFPLDFQGFYRG